MPDLAVMKGEEIQRERRKSGGGGKKFELSADIKDSFKKIGGHDRDKGGDIKGESKEPSSTSGRVIEIDNSENTTSPNANGDDHAPLSPTSHMESSMIKKALRASLHEKSREDIELEEAIKRSMQDHETGSKAKDGKESSKESSKEVSDKDSKVNNSSSESCDPDLLATAMAETLRVEKQIQSEAALEGVDFVD